MLIRPNCYRPIIAALAAMLVGACVSTADKAPLPTTSMPVQESSDSPALLRQGRYTLVELRPDAGQQDLQQQIIELRIPATNATTVGDAMRYVLRRSGYQLCEGDPALATLWALPLPAVHLQLGPLPLNQTLQLLAGAAWHLSIDERARQVCFIAVPLNGGRRP
ncbi:PilL protein [Pseudomonas orientalis]|uniref:PFGI-1 class ICE element type IV pilus protein PilL2 n=1 Tax=Pseudomonas orientalis TaxID=76758 RepID=UPI000F70D69B|nr:PilL N-terminal domain-containing protein [Pseudomonas orientalis]AZE99509.1 PilL protein [Pseudomonas orientalis]